MSGNPRLMTTAEIILIAVGAVVLPVLFVAMIAHDRKQQRRLEYSARARAALIRHVNDTLR